LRTFSKAYGLAGLRLGYAIGKPELISYLQRVRVPFNASTVAQAAALAALDDVAHLRRCIELNASERTRVTVALEGLGLRVAPSQTNFVCVHVNRPAKVVYDALLRAGVIVRPFGPPLDRHLRISIGLPNENDRLLEVLPGVLRNVPAST
jgi:histidinol-phosphate aminotransferase